MWYFTFFLGVLLHVRMTVAGGQAQCPALGLAGPYCLTLIDYPVENSTACTFARDDLLSTLSQTLSLVSSTPCRENIAALACSFAFKRYGTMFAT
jgi:hypothetical protein